LLLSKCEASATEIESVAFIVSPSKYPNGLGPVFNRCKQQPLMRVQKYKPLPQWQSFAGTIFNRYFVALYDSKTYRRQPAKRASEDRQGVAGKMVGRLSDGMQKGTLPDTGRRFLRI
jgi:hypothetical protein